MAPMSTHLLFGDTEGPTSSAWSTTEPELYPLALGATVLVGGTMALRAVSFVFGHANNVPSASDTGVIALGLMMATLALVAALPVRRRAVDPRLQRGGRLLSRVATGQIMFSLVLGVAFDGWWLGS